MLEEVALLKMKGIALSGYLVRKGDSPEGVRVLALVGVVIAAGLAPRGGSQRGSR